jgi:Zn-finger protein
VDAKEGRRKEAAIGCLNCLAVHISENVVNVLEKAAVMRRTMSRMLERRYFRDLCENSG